jgi:DNA-binding protein HU-beta
MNKKELVDSISAGAEITKSEAEKALNAMLGAITQALVSGEKVTLIGFGTFSVVERAARKAKNPRTGDVIDIPARRVPKFKPGSKLIEAVRSEP